MTSYEAESAANGLANIRIYTCPGCSGNKKVGNIGRGMGTLQFNGVTARTGGSATVTIAYVNGESPRVGQVSVNGGPPMTLTFPGTGGWSSVGTMVVTVPLRPGPNTLKMFNPNSAAPDFDKIKVSVR
ncbi:carbohydrate-binding protein [Micromonospora inositola]|uniref:carbohydrate-binding protein n=1 Tax=Micromonospora inositola TaxID=47865 RepID=UPI0012FDEEFF|nr:carbohydrate-binding protein [Micromonospora inositola]